MGKAELCSWIPFLPRKWVGRVQWDGGSASSGRIDANWQLMDQQLSQTKTGRAGSLTFCRAEIGLFGVENPGRNRARAQKRRSCVGFGGLTDPRGMVRNAAAPSQSRFSPNQRDFFYFFFFVSGNVSFQEWLPALPVKWYFCHYVGILEVGLQQRCWDPSGMDAWY